jgi:broad specificity phosphatase PhoE
MQPEAFSLRDAAEFADRVDHAKREVRRRADEHDRIIVDHGLDRGEVHAKTRPDRRPTNLKVHQLRAFVESGMQRLGADDIAA